MSPKFWMVTLSMQNIELLLVMAMPLFPVKLLPSIVPPDMEIRVADGAAMIAEFAAVEELIWIVPFNKTHVSDCSVNGADPTVNVPFRCRTITLFGFAESAELYWLCTLAIDVDEIVRSVRPMPFSIVVECWLSIRGG